MKREDIVKFVIDCVGKGILYRKLQSRENNFLWFINVDFDIFVTYQYVENFGDSEYIHIVTEKILTIDIEEQLTIELSENASFDKLTQQHLENIIEFVAYKKIIKTGTDNE